MPPFKLIGYPDRWSAEPGQIVQFMVSSELPRFRADIVRLIRGSVDPSSPAVKEEAVESSLNGEYAGKVQPIPTGSYVSIPDQAPLRLTSSFTLQAWIAHTRPGKGVQAVMTKWSDADRSGYGLVVEEDGSLGLWLGGPDGRVEKVRSGKPLKPAIAASTYPSIGLTLGRNANTYAWSFVAATYAAFPG